MNTALKAQILALLQTLTPQYVDLQDESALHAGHREAGDGSHWQLTIIAQCFHQQSRLNRHRLVYQALTGLMPHPIHALAIQAYSPEEFDAITN